MVCPSVRVFRVLSNPIIGSSLVTGMRGKLAAYVVVSFRRDMIPTVRLLRFEVNAVDSEETGTVADVGGANEEEVEEAHVEDVGEVEVGEDQVEELEEDDIEVGRDDVKEDEEDVEEENLL